MLQKQEREKMPCHKILLKLKGSSKFLFIGNPSELEECKPVHLTSMAYQSSPREKWSADIHQAGHRELKSKTR